jgi:hypothetical protein
MVKMLNDDSPEYEVVKDSFTPNGDESNFMASEGTVRVIGNKKKRKQEKNPNNSCESITCLRIGSTAGEEGPGVFLTKGKSLGHHRRFNIHNFAKTYRSPPGSHVIPTLLVYTTDDTWIELAELLAQGI